MINLIKHYKKLGIADNYYENIKCIVNSRSDEYIQNTRFLENISIPNVQCKNEQILTKAGDVRIDVPVWFGDIEKTNKKIVVIGLEPRDTNDLFNLSRNKSYVYASPFGIERWNTKSCIKFKPQNKYLKVFDSLLNDKKYVTTQRK